ncbi:response regulator [Actinospica robiniae]|uniref:response regulator n=1 Tax=Actinospica robiniae TaxID=304901 RepID=UPI000414B1DD|nr:response regulator [Actinospica robiniae]
MIDAPILLVEDNPDDVLLTRRAFAKNGFENEIVAATDGEECLTLLLPEDGRSGLKPALVLLDINLPKISGLDVLGRLRADARTSLVPVVVLTTSRERRDILNCYLAGANSFVCKPVSFAGFTELIQTLASYWLGVNEPCPDPGTL